MKNKKNESKNWGKPYPNPPKHYDNRPSNQRTTATGFSCGSGSKPTTSSAQIVCYRCGKPSHISSTCADKDMTCFNYRNKGHIQRDFPYSKVNVS